MVDLVSKIGMVGVAGISLFLAGCSASNGQLIRTGFQVLGYTPVGEEIRKDINADNKEDCPSNVEYAK